MHHSKKVCPVCKTKNELEAIVCRHCGARLDDLSLDVGHATTDMQALTPEMLGYWSFKAAKEVVIPDHGIAFYVEGQSNHAQIDYEGEFVLGRKTGTTSAAASEVLLDLSPLGGLGLGLSRRHAAIRQNGRDYEVLDLESVNGTWLNEQRLVPHKPYPLPSGSHLRLGRMRLLVLYKHIEPTKEKR